MKKNSVKTSARKQKTAELSKARRLRRKVKLDGMVSDKTKSLVLGIKKLETALSSLQESVQTQYVKIAELTKENVQLKKQTDKKEDVDA